MERRCRGEKGEVCGVDVEYDLRAIFRRTSEAGRTGGMLAAQLITQGYLQTIRIIAILVALIKVVTSLDGITTQNFISKLDFMHATCEFYIKFMPLHGSAECHQQVSYAFTVSSISVSRIMANCFDDVQYE